MRTREEIWNEREYKGTADSSLVIEVLLDIRDLLTTKSSANRMSNSQRCKNCGGLGYTTHIEDSNPGIDSAPQIVKTLCPQCRTTIHYPGNHEQE